MNLAGRFLSIAPIFDMTGDKGVLGFKLWYSVSKSSFFIQWFGFLPPKSADISGFDNFGCPISPVLHYTFDKG